MVTTQDFIHRIETSNFITCFLPIQRRGKQRQDQEEVLQKRFNLNGIAPCDFIQQLSRKLKLLFHSYFSGFDNDQLVNSHLHCWKERTKVRKVTKFKVDTLKVSKQSKHIVHTVANFYRRKIGGWHELVPRHTNDCKIRWSTNHIQNWKSTNFKAFVLAVLTDFR